MMASALSHLMMLFTLFFVYNGDMRENYIEVATPLPPTALHITFYFIC